MRLVSQTQAAKLAGTTAQAVSQASRNSGPLTDARHGTKIDIESEAWHRWASKFKPGEERGRGRPLKVRDPIDIDLDGDDLDELKALKLQEDIREKRLKNEQTEGALIAREFVKTHLFGLLEELSRRILADGSRTIARKLYTAARSGVPLEEAEAMVRDILSQHLKKARDLAKRRIRGA